jgi:hypothetical protein
MQAEKRQSIDILCDCTFKKKNSPKKSQRWRFGFFAS